MRLFSRDSGREKRGKNASGCTKMPQVCSLCPPHHVVEGAPCRRSSSPPMSDIPRGEPRTRPSGSPRASAPHQAEFVVARPAGNRGADDPLPRHGEDVENTHAHRGGHQLDREVTGLRIRRARAPARDGPALPGECWAIRAGSDAGRSCRRTGIAPRSANTVPMASIGAMMKRSRSAFGGMKSSLVKNLMPSRRAVCNKPKTSDFLAEDLDRPPGFGPIRPGSSRPDGRSAQVRMPGQVQDEPDHDEDLDESPDELRPRSSLTLRARAVDGGPRAGGCVDGGASDELRSGSASASSTTARTRAPPRRRRSASTPPCSPPAARAPSSLTCRIPLALDVCAGPLGPRRRRQEDRRDGP